MAKNWLDIVALILVIIGAVNWGLVGIGAGNVVEGILGTGMVTSIIYILVGLAGLYTIYIAVKK